MQSRKNGNLQYLIPYSKSLYLYTDKVYRNMNKLSQYLVDQILLEEKSPIKKVIVVYGGRFQPMHKGHFGTYMHLVKKFGKQNVFVSTSNKVERPKSPFNFKEKKKIMTSMFPLPGNKIIKVKNNYNPIEILGKYDKKTTAFVTVVGQKDASRFSSKYFQKWDGNPMEGYEDRGYLYIAPMQGNSVSGTEVRNGLSVGSDDQKEKFFKSRAYSKFNKTIFNMITDKLNESIEVKKQWIYDSLNEISKIAGDGLDVDDGPNIIYPSAPLFKKISIKRAAQIGFDVVNDILGGQEAIDKTDYRVYDDGPVGTVTFFPAGVIGTTTANNQIDIYSSGAYSKWFTHATRKASLVGYEVVKGLGINQKEKEESTDDAKGAKEVEKEFEASLNENIVLPVKVGDTIMTGRFKNKKTVVKTIGKDEHGMPTINGRKVVTFRLMKEGFIAELAGTAIDCPKCNHSWELESDDDEKYLCHNCGYDSQKQEYDYDAFDSWQEKNGMLDERSGKLRPSQKLARKRAMAGKARQIARKRKRTMMRRKGYDKLKKIAYKMAYRQVYDEFLQDLFPGMKKSELSIQQSKVVHRNVLRKKKRVFKRAKFRFLPALRAKEADKFTKKDETNELMIGYAGPEDMKRFAKRNKEYRKTADSNKEYQFHTIKEVNEFFYMDFQKYIWKRRGEINRKLKGLSPKEKKTFFELLWKKQFGANKSWSKVDGTELHRMLKKDKYVKEALPTKVTDKFKSVKHDKDSTESEKDFNKHHNTSMYAPMGSLAEPDTIDFDDDDKEGGHQSKEKDTKKKGYEPVTENILLEGGAYGHMAHPFDTDINLTFGQLKDIVNRALEGTLEFTREKTDGQALAISWRDGRLVAARNKGHLKNKGENALDIKGVSDKFQGRGGLSDAYNFAMKDLSKAISSLSDKQRDKIFKEGSCFMNLEVIYPTSVNVIAYGQALLVFHGTMEYDDDGNAIGENKESARILAGMIKQVEKNVQDNYTIQGPPVVKLPKSQDLSKKRGKYSTQISKLQKEFKLKDTDGVANYHQAWWEQWVDKNSPSSLDNKTKMGLVKRWAFMDKKFRLDKKNIIDEKTLEWAKKTDKDDHKKISKQNLMKFEQIFLGLGAEVLEFTSSALTVNPDKAIRDIKKRIDKTIKDVKKSGDPKKIEKLKLELGRLNSIGGTKKIVPNEGIVFDYKGKTFKLTGTFASVNQILGIFF